MYVVFEENLPISMMRRMKLSAWIEFPFSSFPSDSDRRLPLCLPALPVVLGVALPIHRLPDLPYINVKINWHFTGPLIRTPFLQ